MTLTLARCDNCGGSDGTVTARPATDRDDPRDYSVQDFGHGDLCDSCERDRRDAREQELALVRLGSDAG